MIATNGAALASILLGVVVLSGQEPTAPTFEVASVKRNNTSELGRQGALFRENINTTKGTDTLRNVTLNSCIKWAYGLQDPQISGPDWITAERYDIVAKSSGPTSEGELRLMLRTLLADRFKLIVHSEIRSLSVIALTVGKTLKSARLCDGTCPYQLLLSTRRSGTTEDSRCWRPTRRPYRFPLPLCVLQSVLGGDESTGVYPSPTPSDGRGRLAICGGPRPHHRELTRPINHTEHRKML